MGRSCLNHDDGARHESNSRQPTGICEWTAFEYDTTYRPFLARPISNFMHTVIFGKWELRIARMKTELTNVAKLYACGRGCVGSNPVALGTPPTQRKNPIFNRILKTTKIEVVMQVEFVRRLRQINPADYFEVALHNYQPRNPFFIPLTAIPLTPTANAAAQSLLSFLRFSF